MVHTCTPFLLLIIVAVEHARYVILMFILHVGVDAAPKHLCASYALTNTEGLNHMSRRIELVDVSFPHVVASINSLTKYDPPLAFHPMI